MATIYRKTVKGVQEIETRALKLAPRFRSLLILVDGRRSDDELLRMVTSAGDQGLQALAEGGFIEAIGLTAESAPRPPPAAATPPVPAAPAPPAPGGAGFEQRRRDAVRALIDHVGPMGEALALRMERSRSPEELAALLATAAQIIANTRGRDAAASYLRRFVDA
jgi:hypothetical protein